MLIIVTLLGCSRMPAGATRPESRRTGVINTRLLESSRISSRNDGGPDMGEKLVVIGQGYVGLPLAMRAVEAGFDVVGLDVDAPGQAADVAESFVEDIPTTGSAAALAHRPLPAQHRLRRRRGLRHLRDHGADPAARRRSRPRQLSSSRPASASARYVRPGCTVILESTTYPGTTEELLRPLLEDGQRAAQPRATSTSATAPSGSTRATRPGGWRTRRRSSPASTRRRWPGSTAFYRRLVERDRAGATPPGWPS